MNKSTYQNITSRLPLKQRTELEVKKLMYTYPKSTKKEDIIEWIIETRFVDYYCIKLISESDVSIDDVIQDIYLILCEKSQKEWDKLTCQGFAAVRAYISGIIYREIVSAHSKSYYKYRRYNQNRSALDDVIPSLELSILNTYEKNCTE